MKTLIFITGIMLAALTSVAQEVEILRPFTALIDEAAREGDLQLDLTDKVIRAKTNHGKQLLATVKDIRLYVEVQGGKVVEYTTFDLRGKELQVTTNKAAPTCQVCVEEAGTICWRVSCSQLPGQ